MILEGIGLGIGGYVLYRAAKDEYYNYKYLVEQLPAKNKSFTNAAGNKIKFINYKDVFMPSIKPLISSVVMSVAVFLFIYFVNLNVWVEIVVAIIIGAALYYLFEMIFRDEFVVTTTKQVFGLIKRPFIKKSSGNKTKIVQLMNPGAAGFSEADLIVLPMHDGYRGRAQNVMQTLGAPHRVTRDRLAQELEKWRSVFEKYASPRVSVIVGGATKQAPFTVDMAERLASDVLFLNPASILVTTSRRTPKEVVEVLKKRFPKEQTYFYEFGNEGENPYFGLLAWGTKIVVTGDSMSMCSEACASGVPVFIFAPPGTMGKKHMRFHQELVSSGYASILGSGQTAFGGSLNAAADVAEKIKSLFSSDLS